MRLIRQSVLFAGLAVAAARPALAAPLEFDIDPGHTFPVFEVRHLGIATQRGRFDRTSGKIILDGEAGTGSGEIRIEAASISTGNPDLDRLLRGAGYFNPAQHPVITYSARSMRFEGGKPVLVEGELSFLGVTRSLALRVSGYGCIRFPQLRCGADLSASFRRSEFGLNAMAGFIGDEVNMLVQAEIVRP